MRQELLNRVKKIATGYNADAEVILFGSRARGDGSEFSDWDLLILLDGEVNEVLKDQIRDSLFDLEIETDQVISSIIYSKLKWEELSVTPLFENVKKEGVVV